MKWKRLTVWSLMILVFLTGNSLSAPTDNIDDYNYVINLATRDTPVKYYPPDGLMEGYRVYVLKRQLDNKPVYQLRLGFFKTENDARQFLARIEHSYLNPSIDSVTPTEQNQIRSWLATQLPHALQQTSEQTSDFPLTELNKLAAQAMQENHYSRAIGLYTRIFNSGPSVYQQHALESLGLARERNQQLAHAIAEYQLYLKMYPSGEGALRVQRRIDSLLARQLSVKTTTPVTESRPADNRWLQYGHLYQFYHKDTLDINNTGSITANSHITTNFNYTGRSPADSQPMQANVSATHTYDTDNTDNNKERLTSLYFDMESANRIFDMRLGRQKNKTSNIFNRYDGIDLGYLITQNYRPRIIAGYPVEFTQTVDDATDKYFYSLGLEISPNSKTWSTSLFYLEQTADGLLDRREIAIDSRFQTLKKSFYASLDYSIQYETLNFALLSYNQYYANNATLSLIADYRKTPFLTTTNALQGQVGISSLTDLLSTLSEDEIEQLSLDRTATYRSMSAYYSTYVSTDLQMTTDLTISDMSGTVASAGVAALAETGTEYSYSLGLIRQNLFMPNDQNIINLRYSQLSSADIILFNLSSVLRPDRFWRINPKFRYDNRKYDDGRTSTALRPAISAKYKMNKYWQFEMELAYEDKDIDIPDSASTNETSKLFYAGYILAF